MKYDLFRLQCDFLLRQLCASPCVLPDMRVAEPLADPIPSEAERVQHLVDSVHRAFDCGVAVGGRGRRLAKRVFHQVAARLVEKGRFEDAEKLKAYWEEIDLKWAAKTGMSRAKAPAVPGAPKSPLRVRSRDTEAAALPIDRFTKSQRQAFELLLERGRLFFDPPTEAKRGIPIQTNSLMTGPTGTGKSTLLKALAAELSAPLFSVSLGNWIVEGAAEGNPTARAILWHVVHSSRVVLFIDELDKFFESTGSSCWESALRNDLWLVLDRALPWAAFAIKKDFAEQLPAEFKTAEALEHAFKTRVFIVGAGTWQAQQRSAPVIGFGGDTGTTQSVTAEQLIHRGRLPEEVMRRFNHQLIKVEYPDTLEVDSMIQADGLRTLAEDLGERVDPGIVRQEMNQVGLTALTTLKTRLLLERQRRSAIPSPKFAASPRPPDPPMRT